MTQRRQGPTLLGLEDDGRDLFGLAAHKLNTPIAALRGFIATLLQRGDQLDPETVKQFHTVMLAQTDKLQSMVRDFLAGCKAGSRPCAHDAPPRPAHRADRRSRV